MGKKAISTTEAPQAIGPYSQAIQAGQFLFLSGQIALDPKTGTVVSGDVVEQTHRVMKNLKAVLAAAGASLENIVKTTIYLKKLTDFVRVNEVYGTYFEKEPPARATVEVSNLPKGVDVEIEAIAYLGN
ncbi:MAG: RidA family protein [Calditrichaeota bacterium]|nr:MAG: RidA family protein [Calditrichota bacterium]